MDPFAGDSVELLQPRNDIAMLEIGYTSNRGARIRVIIPSSRIPFKVTLTSDKIRVYQFGAVTIAVPDLATSSHSPMFSIHTPNPYMAITTPVSRSVVQKIRVALDRIVEEQLMRLKGVTIPHAELKALPPKPLQTEPGKDPISTFPGGEDYLKAQQAFQSGQGRRRTRKTNRRLRR